MPLGLGLGRLLILKRREKLSHIHADTSQCAAPSIVWHTLAVTILSRSDFAARGFRHSAPAVWNSLPIEQFSIVRH